MVCSSVACFQTYTCSPLGGHSKGRGSWGRESFAVRVCASCRGLRVLKPRILGLPYLDFRLLKRANQRLPLAQTHENSRDFSGGKYLRPISALAATSGLLLDSDFRRNSSRLQCTGRNTGSDIIKNSLIQLSTPDNYR